MSRISPGAAVLVLLAVGVMGGFVRDVGAQTPVEYSSEARFQLDLHVPDAALAPFLPSGWIPNVAVQGPAKDANLRAVFIDRLTINGPDGKPAGRTGSNRPVYLVAPVKEPGGSNVQLVIGGLTEDLADAPGPFGNYLLATTHSVQRTTTVAANAAGPAIDTQDWSFAAATGEHIEMHMKYERGGGNRGAMPRNTSFYSAKTPTLASRSDCASRASISLDSVRSRATASR